MGELIVYRQEFYNPHQEHFRDFFLAGAVRRFKQLPKGNVIWDAGFVLSKYLEDHCEGILKDKKILEIGSGTGIVGITAALLGGKVTMTDGSDLVLQLLEQNVETIFDNSPTIMPEVKKLEWNNTDQQSAIASCSPFDYILCADVVYAPAGFLPLINTLRAFTSTHPLPTILFAYKKRYDVEDQFFAMAAEFFRFEREPQSKLHLDFQSADIFLYKVTKITSGASGT